MAKLPFISSDHLLEALRNAELADASTRRVVIDLTVGQIATVYIEKYGDERLIEVINALPGVEIATVPATATIQAPLNHGIKE